MHVASKCSNCEADARSTKREFSEQAWSVLLVWEEIDAAVVDQPLCNDCYDELREILIDRSHEIELALSQPVSQKQPSQPRKSSQEGKSKVSAKKTASKSSSKKTAAKKAPAAKKGKKVSRLAS